METHWPAVKTLRNQLAICSIYQFGTEEILMEREQRYFTGYFRFLKGFPLVVPFVVFAQPQSTQLPICNPGVCFVSQQAQNQYAFLNSCTFNRSNEARQSYLDDDWTERWFRQGNHKYNRLSNPVCAVSSSGCTLDSVVRAINSNGVHPNQASPFIPGQPYTADVDIPGPFGEDHIRTTAVYNDDGTQVGIRNETMEDHALHPGAVQRTVVEQNGSYYILTEGGGYGYMGGPNIWLDDLVWSPVDQAVIDRF